VECHADFHAKGVTAFGGRAEDAFDVIASYNYGRSGRLDSVLGTSGTDFVNYWQRTWFVGVRAKRLFGHGDRNGQNPYYYDNRTVGSPVIPPIGDQAWVRMPCSVSARWVSAWAK